MTSLKINKLNNNEFDHIQKLAQENEAITITITDNTVDFPLALIGRIISGEGKELARRPWLFDLSDDIIECSMSINTIDEVNLYLLFNDEQQGEQEIEIGKDKATEILAYCVHELQYSSDGWLQMEKVIGRDRDGAPETTMALISLYELLQSDLLGYSDFLTFYAAYLIEEAKKSKEITLAQDQETALLAA